MAEGYRNKRSVPHPTGRGENLYYLSHWLWRRGLRRTAKLVKFANTLLFRNYIPPQVRIGARLELLHGGMGTVIHADTRIGDDAIIGHNVTIGNGGAVIGNRVTIGAGAIVIGAVRVGDDATIGANTVVTKDVPPGATVVGARSRIIARGG